MSEPGQIDAPPLPVFTIRVADTEEFRRDYLQDLSRGGVQVRTDAVVPVDTEVEIHLQPPGHVTEARLRGRVVDITLDQSSGESIPAGMEVKFVGLSRAEELALAALLADFELVEDGTTPTADDNDETAAEAQATRMHARLEGLRVRATALQAELDALAQEDRASRAVVDQLAAQRAKLDAAAQAAAHLDDDLSALEARHAELTEQLRTQIDAGLRQATESAEQAYVLQHRQADALERQAEGLSLELEQQLTDRRERLSRAVAEAAALQEQASAAAGATQEEVEIVRDQLREAKRVQAEVRAGGVSSTAEERQERQRIDGQLETARKLGAARRAANTELVQEVDRAVARRERLETKRRDLERLLGLLPSGTEPSLGDGSAGEGASDDLEVDLSDDSEPMA